MGQSGSGGRKDERERKKARARQRKGKGKAHVVDSRSSEEDSDDDDGDDVMFTGQDSWADRDEDYISKVQVRMLPALPFTLCPSVLTPVIRLRRPPFASIPTSCQPHKAVAPRVAQTAASATSCSTPSARATLTTSTSTTRRQTLTRTSSRPCLPSRKRWALPVVRFFAQWALSRVFPR